MKVGALLHLGEHYHGPIQLTHNLQTMPARKIEGRWHVDFRIHGMRVRQVSPVNTKSGALAFERALLQGFPFQFQGAPFSPVVLEPVAPGPVSAPAPVEPPAKTFAEFAHEWVETYARVNNKPSEVARKRDDLRVHLLPEFGDKPLGQIGVRDIEVFKAKRLAKRLKPKTVNNLLATLRRALVCAKQWGLVEGVPAFQWLKVEPQRFDFLTPDEQERLLAASGRWRVMVSTALQTGMRWGELAALRWDDVDLDKRRITVRRSITRGIESSTKSNRVRHLPTSQILTEELRLHTRTGEFVFGREPGRPVTYACGRKAIGQISKRAGLRPISWHVLRHTYASTLVAKGIPLRYVQQLLGHSTVVMTERYSHLSPDSLDRAAHVFDQIFAPAWADLGQIADNPSPNSSAHEPWTSAPTKDHPAITG